MTDFVVGAMDYVTEALGMLNPEDLFAAWAIVDDLEQSGQLPAGDAVRLKTGILGLLFLAEDDEEGWMLH